MSIVEQMASLHQQQQQRTRIPKFGSRIPLPGQTATKVPKIEATSPEFPAGALGKKVRVNDREGTLRYIGPVQFASGTWCGIEVNAGGGKNDGSVRGVRYFACPKTCGLMAPLSKVELTKECPYSMIIGLSDEKSTFLRSKTFDKIDYTPSRNDDNCDDVNQSVIYKSAESLQKSADGNSAKEKELSNNKYNKRNFVLENLISNNRKLPANSANNLDEDNGGGNKRDSLELEESLGILTPNQMLDVAELMGPSTTSTENLLLQLDNDNTSSMRESLGIIDLSAMNVHLNRLDQTPSPEELPLDPIPIMEAPSEENKQTQSSIITSITSTTSLDTGYQGDGELSRPESRGADQLSLPRRPQVRPCSRRTDPMTDSDFYTESDADNHDEHPLRGDRKAQVIDGTLYGVDAQATADLYANNRENMDSSGIFTDIERTDDVVSVNDNVVELSPSDSSTKTISDDSQSNVKLIINKSSDGLAEDAVSNSSTVVSTNPSNISNASNLSNQAEKKHKMPKRNVTSKVKAMMEEPMNNKENEKRHVKKLGAGRWDAVMNKISKSTGDVKNFKEVKSKVFNSLGPNVQRNNSENKQQKPLVNNRRVRSRLVPTAKKCPGSINNSSSDISSSAGNKQSVGPIEKKREVFRVGLNSSKQPSNLKARNNVKNSNNDISNNKISKKTLFSSIQDKKNATAKENGKPLKGGRISPNTRPPHLLVAKQPPEPKLPIPRTTEALAILVQHLVYNLEAFSTPKLKKELEKVRFDAEEMRISYKELEESFSDEKQRHGKMIEDEREKYRAEITQLIEKHRNELLQVKETMQSEAECERRSTQQRHEEQMLNLRAEFEKLQRTLDSSVEILREENDATRAEIDAKNEQIKAFRAECEELRRQNESKDQRIAELSVENGKFKEDPTRTISAGDTSVQEVESLRVVLELKQAEFAEMRKSLALAQQKADQLPSLEERLAVLNAKCEDLQHQLERKKDCETQLIAENKKLNESFKEMHNREQRVAQVNEELMWKLQQNKEVVSKVLEEAEASAFSRYSTISGSFNERHTCNRSTFERMLSLRGERRRSENGRKYRSTTSTDAADLDVSPPQSPKVKAVVEKSDSLSYVLEMDDSPEVAASRIMRRSFRNPTPPKNNTPTKSPANKRPRKSNPLSLSASESRIGSKAVEAEECRMTQTARVAAGDEEFFRWPQLQSLSASTPDAKCLDRWTTNEDFEGDVDIEINIPALPSEIGRKNANTLPLPKHFAGEAMISESNSEEDDESVTGSSSSGPL